jgi:hypothetical protein
MADLVDRVRKELDARIEQLRPLVGELERLERAAAALAHAGARAVPGLGARPPAAATPAGKPGRRSTRAKPATRTPSARRRGTATGRTPAPAAAKPQSRPAGRATRSTPATRKPPARPRAAASGRTTAPRGQTQARVLAALGAAPGSTTAAIAAAAGIPANTTAATLSRLVKQGRVRRLDEGGYAPAEPPTGAAPFDAEPAITDASPVVSDTPDATALARPDNEIPR